jgi:outer membrane protein OmpA-like peptidoglycan-associated protein
VGDRDHDGLTDDADRCPEQPETYNGRDDTDGCPDGEVLGERVNNRIEIREQVRFRTDSDQLVGARSFAILDAVVAILNANPDIARLDVQGHTDDRGSAEHNRDLSQRRAASVVAYLRDHGVGAARLESHGFGPDRPLVPGQSRAARAANRRVEFHIVPAAAAGGG